MAIAILHPGINQWVETKLQLNRIAGINFSTTFPWIRIGKYSSQKYGKYNIHHTGVGYRHLGYEELWKDVVPLCRFAHWIIHGGNMKAKAPWQPNLIQKSLHLWCHLPLLFKQLFLVITGFVIALYFSIWMALVFGIIIFYLLFC